MVIRDKVVLALLLVVISALWACGNDDNRVIRGEATFCEAPGNEDNKHSMGRNLASADSVECDTSGGEPIDFTDEDGCPLIERVEVDFNGDDATIRHTNGEFNCAGSMLVAREMEGTTLVLVEYQDFSGGGAMAACTCPRSAEYQIDNLAPEIALLKFRWLCTLDRSYCHHEKMFNR